MGVAECDQFPDLSLVRLSCPTAKDDAYQLFRRNLTESATVRGKVRPDEIDDSPLAFILPIFRLGQINALNKFLLLRWCKWIAAVHKTFHLEEINYWIFIRVSYWQRQH